MEELVNKIVDAVMAELDGELTGYHSEFGGFDTDEAKFKREIRADLEKCIRDVLKGD